MEKTVRQMIEERRIECLKTDVTIDRAAELLKEITALLGNVNQEIIRTEMLYNRKLQDIYNLESKANRAKITSQATKEYEERLIARATKEITVELIRSLKFYLKAKSEEYQHSA